MLREITVYKWLAFIIFVAILSAVTIGIANAQTEGLDKFGIKKIYPTKPGGREWFVNTSNPKNDSLFSITFNPDIKSRLMVHGISPILKLGSTLTHQRVQNNGKM